MHKTWEFGTGAQQTFAGPLTYRVAKVIKSQGGPRRGEAEGVTGVRASSEEASGAGGERRANWTSISPAVTWGLVGGVT